MKIKYYINLAKKNNNLKSDAQLAKMLGIHPNSLCNIVNKKVRPKQENLLKILDLAKISDEERRFIMLDYVASYRPNSEFSKLIKEQMKSLPFYQKNARSL